MSLLPSRGPDASASQDGELEIVGVDEDVSAIIDALSSDTAREILNAVYEDPCTPSELADRLDMSIQKVSYHLEKLEDEELIAVAGTRYSEKGQKMKVYQPPDDPLVLFVGTRDRKRSLRSLAQRLLPVVGILTAASVVVQVILQGIPFVAQTGGADGGEAASQSGGGDSGSDLSASQGAESTSTPTPESEVTLDSGSNATTTPTDSGPSIQQVTEEPTTTPTPEPAATETPVPTDAPAPTETPVADAPIETATEISREVSTTVAMSGSSGFEIEPGVAFFLGGLFVVAMVAVVWGYDQYR